VFQIFVFFQTFRRSEEASTPHSKRLALAFFLCSFRFLSVCRGLLHQALSAQTENDRAQERKKVPTSRREQQRKTMTSAPNASSAAAAAAAATQVAVRFVTRLPLEYRVPDEPVVRWGQDMEGNG
jgi:hypothetical protein